MAPSNGLKQTNISSFFNPRAQKTSEACQHSSITESSEVSRKLLSDIGSVRAREVPVTYQRRNSKPSKKSDDKIDVGTSVASKEDGVVTDGSSTRDTKPHEPTESGLIVMQSRPAVLSETSTTQVQPEKIPSRKRVFGQYFLELGQSDFYLSTCTVCGLRYSRGDEEDEKTHKSFHRSHLQGVQFKGWKNERIVSFFDGDDRIILVLSGDPPQHQHKVKEVVTVMEKEMGLTNAWLLHKFCKVYLFISSKRIVGCLVSEPIKYGFRVIPACLSVPQGQHCNMVYSSPKEILDGVEGEGILTNTTINSKNSFITDKKYLDNENQIKRGKHESTVMHFGNVKLTRQVLQTMHLTRDSKSSCKDPAGAIIYSEVPVPAVCGVRGLWVSRSERRKGIATKLLDAMRKTFCLGYILEPCQCAFSQPTSDGKDFAASYCQRDSFLIYKSSIHGT